MDEYAVNILLMKLLNDYEYSEETRMLAEQLLKSNCSLEAKNAIIEECIEARNE